MTGSQQQAAVSVICDLGQFTLKAQPAPYFREELFISTQDAGRLGLNDTGQFGILSIEPLYPGPPDEQFAVRIRVDANVEPSTVHANQNFLDNVKFRPGEDNRLWSVSNAPTVVSVKEAVIELVVEQGSIDREINALRREQLHLFLNRCLLVQPGNTVKYLSLPMVGRGYFNIRSIQPTPEMLSSRALLVFDEKTTLNLFVPHRKSGVDMVILVDASNSMDLSDYVGADNRVRSRLEGVRVALEMLFQRRLASGSRVSRIAAIVFGADTQMLYPPQKKEMVELRSEAQIEEIRASTRSLSPFGLTRLNVDRGSTNISGGLIYAAGLLNSYSQEGNEKMIVLLSDGADWVEDTDSKSEGEIVSTAHDPAVLADNLHYDSQIRIHTVAISSEQALRQYEDRAYWDKKWAVPNVKLLQKIADFTEGLFFERPDARVLAKLLDEIGEGAMYPI